MQSSTNRFYSESLRKVHVIFAQAGYLSKALYAEHQRLEKEIDKAKKMKDNTSVSHQGGVLTITNNIPFVNTTYRSSLEFSLLLIQFSTLEAMVNSISDCALHFDSSERNLSEAEYNFLTESTQIYDKGKIKERSKFSSLEDKLTYYPSIFGDLHNIDFKLKKETHWQLFLKSKIARDSISHPKADFLGRIDINDLFASAKILYWYQQIIFKLFKDCTGSDFDYKGSEVIAFDLLCNINLVCNKGDKDSISDEIKNHKKITPSQKL